EVNGWFTHTEDAESGAVTYHVAPHTEELCADAVTILGDQLAAVDGFLAHFAEMTTDDAELFSTIYAAWNDLLLDGRAAAEAAIVAEVYGWHESKKKFS